MVRKRIGILTGGGDVPGLNVVIKSVTYRGRRKPSKSLVSWLGGPHAPEPRVPDQQVTPHHALIRENTRTHRPPWRH